MFGKSLPASGIYARHVRGLTLKNVQINLTKADARPATVLVDVVDITPVGFAVKLSCPK